VFDNPALPVRGVAKRDIPALVLARADPGEPELEWHAELAPHPAKACHRAYRLEDDSVEAWLSATSDDHVEFEGIHAAGSSNPQIRRFQLSAGRGPDGLPTNPPVKLTTLLAKTCGVAPQPLEKLVPLLAANAATLVSFQQWLGRSDAIKVELTQEFPESLSSRQARHAAQKIRRLDGNLYPSVGERISVTADGKLALKLIAPDGGFDRSSIRVRTYLIEATQGDLADVMAGWLKEPARPLDELLPLIASSDLNSFLDLLDDSKAIRTTPR